MKIKYKTNFVGYISILRGVLLLLKSPGFGFTQLGAYIAFVMQADFDRRHDNYRVVIRDDEELANDFHCHKSTINRRRKELIKLGLLTEHNGMTIVTNYYVFEKEWIRIFAKLSKAVVQNLFATSHTEIEKKDYFVAETQKRRSQKSIQSSNFPSKGELSLSDEDISDIEDSLSSYNDEGK